MTAHRAALAALALAAAGLVAGCASAPPEGDGRVAAIDVRFVGNSALFDFQLQRVVEDLLIDFAREPDVEAPLFDAAAELEDYYRARGYADVTVGYRVEGEPASKVVFDVNEGPEVTVTPPLHFEGRAGIDADELTALWSRTASGLLGTGDPLFVRADLESLRWSMLDLYDARGYLDVRIDGPAIEREPGSDRVTVSFTIDEGERYRLRDVTIDHELELLPADLGLADEIGQLLDRTRVQELAVRARTVLRRGGHPRPEVRLDVTIDRDERTVTAHLRGRAGPRERIRNVRIEGLDRTAEYVVARHVTLAPGTWYDGTAVDDAVQRLYLTGLFGRVDAKAVEVAGEPGICDLVVTVDELRAREVSALVGYGSYETLRGGLFYTDRNLFGLGQRLQLGARASLKSSGLTASWTEPYLFGSDWQFTVAGHLSRREEPAFTDRSHGLDLAFSRHIWGPLRGRFGYALQRRDGSDINAAVRGIADEQYEIATVFGELLIDRLDSPLYPESGQRARLKIERAADFLGSSVELERLTLQLATFHPLTDDLVIGLGASAGLVWPGDLRGLPVQERFFLGGESSVRSFEEAELGPLQTDGTPIGGQYFTNFSAELRFPLVRALHGAVFADAGNVGRDVDSFGLSKMRYGIGGGLRLVLPIGPVRLDGAVNPDRNPGEETWVLHLTVGLPF